MVLTCLSSQVSSAQSKVKGNHALAVTSQLIQLNKNNVNIINHDQCQ